MLRVAVEGGTGAGSRVVKARPLWACRCKILGTIGVRDVSQHRLHPGEAYSCPDCGARRPS